MGLRASGFGAFDALYGSQVTVGFQKNCPESRARVWRFGI